VVVPELLRKRFGALELSVPQKHLTDTAEGVPEEGLMTDGAR